VLNIDRGSENEKIMLPLPGCLTMHIERASERVEGILISRQKFPVLDDR
jgi:hypothetical protein